MGVSLRQGGPSVPCWRGPQTAQVRFLFYTFTKCMVFVGGVTVPGGSELVLRCAWRRSWSLAAEILELAGSAARDSRGSRIIPGHLRLAIRNDEELNGLAGVAIAQGGVLPDIQAVLLPKRSGSAKEKA